MTYVNPFAIASAFAMAGEFDRVMQRLERAAEARTPELIYVDVRSRLEPLHSDPRYRASLQRMGLPAMINQRVQ